MNNEEIVVKIAEHDNRIKVSENRIKDLEEQNKTLNEIAVSTSTLATNMKYMAKEQQKQGERLEQLEHEPAENAKYYRRLIIGCALTAIISIAIGALISHLFG